MTKPNISILFFSLFFIFLTLKYLRVSIISLEVDKNQKNPLKLGIFLNFFNLKSLISIILAYKH